MRWGYGELSRGKPEHEISWILAKESTFIMKIIERH